MSERAETPADGASASRDEVSDDGRPTHRGRLELTWTNKQDALLSREDGSYEWVPRRDHRGKEVRLLRDAGTVATA